MCFIGYTPSHHSYLCLNPLNNKVFISQHVIFNEEFPFRDNLSTHSLHSSTYPSFLLPIPSRCLPSISPPPSSSSSPTILFLTNLHLHPILNQYLTLLKSSSPSLSLGQCPSSSSHTEFVPDISVQSSPSPYHHSPILDLILYPPCRQNLLSILRLHILFTYRRSHPTPHPTNFLPRLPSKQCSTSPSSPPLMPAFPLTYHHRHLLPLSTLPPCFSSSPLSYSLQPSRHTTKSK